MRLDFSKYSYFKALCFLLALFIILTVDGAPRRYNDDSNKSQVRDARTSLEVIRHEVDNHETEIRMLEERIANQETTISSLRQQVLDANQASKDFVQGNTSTLDSKMSSLDTTNKGIVSDLQQLRTHANDSSALLAQYKQKIAELEKLIAQQNQNTENLKIAMNTLMDALDLKEGLSKVASNDKIYRIKPGDSLEKIAKANHTSIKAIKDINNLPSDRIVVGQTLKMP